MAVHKAATAWKRHPAASVMRQDAASTGCGTSSMQRQENNDAFAAWTCDVLEHVDEGRGAKPLLSPRIGKTSLRGKRAVENIHSVCDRLILLCESK
jgi:hypothetical protein